MNRIRRGFIKKEPLPVDGGPATWKLLIAAFVFEAILWGMFLLVPILSFFLSSSIWSSFALGKRELYRRRLVIVCTYSYNNPFAKLKITLRFTSLHYRSMKESRNQAKRRYSHMCNKMFSIELCICIFLYDSIKVHLRGSLKIKYESDL